MTCDDVPLLIDRTQILAQIQNGSGTGTSRTLTARVKVPSSKLHVHLAIFARKSDGTLFTPGNTAVWDLVPCWPFDARGGAAGGFVQLKSVFDGAQTLFDGYEIIGSAVQLWQITTTISVSIATAGNGAYYLGATFEPIDPAMHWQERQSWFARCSCEVDGNGTLVLDGAGV
jgi:hypothetical protein